MPGGVFTLCSLVRRPGDELQDIVFAEAPIAPDSVSRNHPRLCEFIDGSYVDLYLGLIAERRGRPNEAVDRYRQSLQAREGAQADLTTEAERRLRGLLGQVRR